MFIDHTRRFVLHLPLGTERDPFSIWRENLPHKDQTQFESPSYPLSDFILKDYEHAILTRNPYDRMKNIVHQLHRDIEGRKFLAEKHFNTFEEVFEYLSKNPHCAKNPKTPWFKAQEDLIKSFPFAKVFSWEEGPKKVNSYLQSFGYAISPSWVPLNTVPEGKLKEAAETIYWEETGSANPYKEPTKHDRKKLPTVIRYYINMDSAEERKFLLEKDARQIGWVLNRISAITPETVGELTDVVITPEIARNNQIELSLLASHLVALRSFVRDSDGDFALVLEDDVNLEATKNWGFSLEELAKNLPPECGMLQLSMIWPVRQALNLEGKPEIHLLGIADLDLRHHRAGLDWGTAAFLIRREHAEKILSFFEDANGKFCYDRYPGPKVADVILYDRITLRSPYLTYSTPLLYARGLDDAASSFDRGNTQQVMHNASRDLTKQLLEKEKVKIPKLTQNPGVLGQEFPFVSIITPTYNRRHLLPLLEERILQQTYPRCRMEWVIVDDSQDGQPFFTPTPGTGLTIRQGISSEKITLGRKRNLIARLARGQIIVCMDDDDYYFPTRVALAVEAFRLRPDNLIAGSTILPIYYLDRDELWVAGPYNDNHTTAGPLAFRRIVLETQKHDDDANYAEEPSFLEKFTLPITQLNPWQTMICFAHGKNTFDKTRLLELKAKNVNLSEKPITEFVDANLLEKYKALHAKPKE